VTRLIDSYDAAFFDLDGVIYVGPVAVDGVVGAMSQVDALGVRVMYLTNNAARSNATVVDHLTRLGLRADAGMVLTSAQVAAVNLARELPGGAKVLVAGSQSLAELIAEAGLRPVASADDAPVAVIQGYDPQLCWPVLDEACLAISRGARWYATNDDASRPTDRGMVPGAGAMIAVIGAALGGAPTTFGKPFRPMMDEAVRRTGALRPVFVGDRIDTDIIGSCRAGIDSLLVFSGAHGKADLVAAGVGERPTHIGMTVSALLAPARTAPGDADGRRCGGVEAVVAGGVVTLSAIPDDVEGQLDALWAVAALAWDRADRGEPVDVSAALDSLDLLH